MGAVAPLPTPQKKHNSYLASFVPNVPKDFNNIKQEKMLVSFRLKSVKEKRVKSR
jgi:hypothetical protein